MKSLLPSFTCIGNLQMHFIPLFLLQVFVHPSVNAQNKKFPDQEGSRWQPYHEWSIPNTTYAQNPFDLQGKVVFHHQNSGNTKTTYMFYAGENTWKFRFTGTLNGTWDFKTYSRDQDLNGYTGKVTIRNNQNENVHGFIKSFGSKWGWQGTEEAFVPQFVMGRPLDTYLDENDKVDSEKINQDIQEFVEEHGFTGFHIPVMGAWIKNENPHPEKFKVVEEFITKVHAKGGACHIWLWGSGGDNEPTTPPGGPMSEVDQRNLRYLAARLGPLPGWTMGYGFDTENGWAPPEELDTWKAFMEKYLGWDHFLGSRVGYDEKGLWAVSPRPPRPPHDAGFRSPIADKYTTWLGGDYTGYTSYRPLFPRYKEVIQHHPDKPSFEEDRFRLRESEQWSYKDYTPELTRRGMWHSALAGGIANIWGNLLPHSENDLGSNPYPIKEQIKTYSRFFENRFLKTMAPVYKGPELQLSGSDSTHYIVYREDTDLVRLNFPRMKEKQPAIAVDTRKPYQEIEIGMISPGNNIWEAPYRSDWAIAVGRYKD